MVDRNVDTYHDDTYHRRNVFAYQERQRIKEFRNKQVYVRKIQGYDSASSFAKFYGNNFDRT